MMNDEPGEKTAVSTADGTLVSRRRLLAAGAMVGIAGGVGGLVGAQEETADVELEGEMDGWIGVAPDGIDGETNPTLELEAGVEQTVVWTNGDGMPHSFVVEDGDGTVLVETETIDEGSQTVTFTATEEMAEYYCGVHPQTMRGDLAVAAGDDGMDDQNDTDGSNDTDEGTAMEGYGTDETGGDDGEGDEVGDDGEGEEDDDGEAEETGDDGETDDDPDLDLPREYRACLSGDDHGIETGASGTAAFEVHDHEDGMEAHYTLTVEGICTVTQAHVHLGSADEDGPVVAWLYPETGAEPDPIDGRFSGTLAEGTIAADDLVGEWEGAAFGDVVATLEEGAAYVNVHTEANPGGEIRGQIRPADG